MSFAIGRSDEECIVRLGLYGNDVAASVDEFLKIVSPAGLKTTSDLVFESGMGVDAIAVSLTRGGILGQIVPGQRLDVGIPLGIEANRYFGKHIHIKTRLSHTFFPYIFQGPQEGYDWDKGAPRNMTSLTFGLGFNF